IVLVVLVIRPLPTAVTLTENVQLAPAAKVAPVRLIRLEPATALIVPPPQEPTTTLGVLTIRPAGSGSENVNPVRVTVPFGFLTVKLKGTDEPCGILSAPNALESCAGLAAINVAVAVPPVPKRDETVPVVLTLTPSFEVTLTVIVQVALAAIAPFASVTEP